MRSSFRFSTLLCSLGALALVASACDDTAQVFGNASATSSTSTGVGAGGDGEGGQGGMGGDDRPPAKADKVDLLLVVDNSRSMGDKQEILSLAVPNLIDDFITPRCVDADGIVVGEPPNGEPCPDGSERQFPAVEDLHIGVITTSLGSGGADTCVTDPQQNDLGRLITRGPGNATVNTYQGLGFLAWDPLSELEPPGTVNASNLSTNLKGLVLGAGQIGCGWESTLESWYRFLVEPNPHATISLNAEGAQLVGTDETLLQQRQAFLRPDSLLLIVTLSDENDCSMRRGGQFFFAAQAQSDNTPFLLPKPRAVCATNPNDPCCRSCGQDPGAGCDTSQDNCESGPLSPTQDALNVRCFDQKRRFGIDFLYPTQRYVDGLTQPEIADRNGNIVRNPLFSDLNPNDAASEVRDERLVYLGSLVGVPWQDIARRDASGNPDLDLGLSASGVAKGGFQSAAELTANGTWDLILGDPAAGVPPADPFMRESIDPRPAAANPVTGDIIAPPGSAFNANAINGHEYSVPGRDDLQYACTFPLIQPRDCTQTSIACECDPGNDNPICQNENNVFTTTQLRAKAYPGLRHLSVARGLGPRASIGSICPAQLVMGDARDFGYLPFVRSLVDSAANVLAP